MAGVIDSFSFILKKSLDWKLWLYLFVISIAGTLAIIISFVVFLLVGLIVFFILALSPVALVLYFLLFVLFLITLFFFSSAITGISLNLTREFIETGKRDLTLAWNKTKGRIFTSVKVEVIVQFFFLLVLLILFLPFILSLINLLAGSAKPVLSRPSFFLNSIMSLLGSFLLSLFLCIIFSIIVLPFSVIYSQIPFFESKGAIESIKRAIYLAKKNYLKNLFFSFLFFIFFVVVLIIYFVLVFALEALTAKIFLLIVLFVLLRIIIEVAYTLWSTAYGFLFSTQVYLMDIEEEKKTKPVKAVALKPKDFLVEVKPKKTQLKTRTKTKKKTKNQKTAIQKTNY
jgi:hypothetical protein